MDNAARAVVSLVTDAARRVNEAESDIQLLSSNFARHLKALRSSAVSVLVLLCVIVMTWRGVTLLFYQRDQCPVLSCEFMAARVGFSINNTVVAEQTIGYPCLLGHAPFASCTLRPGEAGYVIHDVYLPWHSLELDLTICVMSLICFGAECIVISRSVYQSLRNIIGMIYFMNTVNKTLARMEKLRHSLTPNCFFGWTLRDMADLLRQDRHQLSQFSPYFMAFKIKDDVAIQTLNTFLVALEENDIRSFHVSTFGTIAYLSINDTPATSALAQRVLNTALAKIDAALI